MSKYTDGAVGVVKVTKNYDSPPYTPIFNETLRDGTLSNEALGFLCRTIANAENWQTNIASAMKQSPDKKRAVTRQIQELQTKGYAFFIIEKDAQSKAILRRYYRVYEEKQTPEASPIVEFITAENERLTGYKQQSKIQKLLDETGIDDESELVELLKMLKKSKAKTGSMFTPSAAKQPETEQPAAPNEQQKTPPSVFFDTLRSQTDFLDTLRSKYTVTESEMNSLLEIFRDFKKANEHLVYEKYSVHFDRWIPAGLKILAVKNRPKTVKKDGTGKKDTPSVSQDKETILQEMRRYKEMFLNTDDFKLAKEHVLTFLDFGKIATKQGFLDDVQVAYLEKLQGYVNERGGLKAYLDEIKGKNQPVHYTPQNGTSETEIVKQFYELSKKMTAT